MSSSKIIKLARTSPKRVLIGSRPNATAQAPGPVDAAGKAIPDALTSENASEAASDRHIFPGLAGKDVIDNTAERAREMLAQARAESEMIARSAEAEAENVRQQAFEEGFQAGYAEGTMAARNEALERVRQIGELARNASVDMSGILRTLEEGVVGLALSIAEKIVYQRLAEDRDLVVSLVKGALDSAGAKDVMRVRVNPADMETLCPYWVEQQWGDGKIELVADASVQMGGCVIDTKSAVLDAQIDTKLAEIDKALRAELDASAR